MNGTIRVVEDVVNVFEAFPNGVVSGQYELGEVQYATAEGTIYSNGQLCDVIVEEEANAEFDRTPSANAEFTDMLVYARPEQMPTLVAAKLTNGYMWHDVLNNFYYEIVSASLGKNQETGTVEHVEFKVRQTEVVNG